MSFIVGIAPKLPMRSKAATYDYYINQLGFNIVGTDEYPDYFMVEKEGFQIHFFEFKELDPKENYGQIYIRTNKIEVFYQHFIDRGVAIHPNGALRERPWGQKEFHLLDPDNNLLSFGQSI